MSIFDGKIIEPEKFGLDITGLRSGFYSDKYFLNTVALLESMAIDKFQKEGFIKDPRDRYALRVGDIEVEAQIFNRCFPFAVVAGIDYVLAQLRYGVGTSLKLTEEKNTWIPGESLQVESVQDGHITRYKGDPANIKPVMKIRGHYRQFAHLETPMLGILSRASRIATNVYQAYTSANDKHIMFFPARFDMPAVQAMDGYAYYIGAKRYEYDSGMEVAPMVSTDAQGSLWGGKGMGTISHATIACFMGDSADTMVQFAQRMPIEIPRILLADFNNDCIADINAVLSEYWRRFRGEASKRSAKGMKRWTLDAVRLDTSSQLRDKSLPEGAERGVTPQLVFAVRNAIDTAWTTLNARYGDEQLARSFCENVRIIVSGGFNSDKINHFESEKAPVDTYAIGSSLLHNDTRNNCDFTMDIVKVKANGTWMGMSKAGRNACENEELEQIDIYA